MNEAVALREFPDYWVQTEKSAVSFGGGLKKTSHPLQFLPKSGQSDNRSRKENAVALMREQREFVHRSFSGIGHKRRGVGLTSPRNLRHILHKISSEAIFQVAELCPPHWMAPANVP